MKRYILVLLSLTAVLTSCDNNILFDDNTYIENGKWNAGERKSFTVKIEEGDMAYNYRFALNVRHTTDYMYNNIFFFITTVYPDGSVTVKDTVECILADDNGEWKGKGMTDVKDNRFWFASGVTFPMKGEYIFQIEQATRDSVLTGVRDIGLHIEKQEIK